MAFREVMTGGACNVQDSNQRNMNPLNKLLDNMTMGPQQQNFQMVDKTLNQNQNNINQHEQQFMNMNQEWQQAQTQQNQQMIQNKQMMDQQWEFEQSNYLQQQFIQQQMQEETWKNEELNYRAERMAQEFQEQNKIDPQVEQEQILKAADTMVDIMRKDLSPRFKNSKFLKFLEDIQNQKIKIEGDQVVQQKPMESAFNEAKFEEFKEQQQFNDIFQQSQEEFMKQQEQYEQVWSTEQENYMNDMNMMEDTFKVETQNYEFDKQNEFQGQEDLFNLAQKLIADGQPTKAILCLEAALKQKENTMAWHLLGKLHQENDDDNKAVQCLLKAHEKDPLNLDVLLSLGVSCTNNLDETQAMTYLKIWLQNNPKYSSCTINDQLDVDSMLNLFNHALKINDQDPELYTALSVIHFISRDFDGAVQSFKKSLKFDPQNYSLWNKLGATLAHLGMPEEAMEAYNKALDLKPNYVRVWVNLGIAYAYKQDYKEAARFYLNALSFNPQADHLWNYLQTTFMCMQRFDLSEKTYQRDINQFRNEFEILDLSDLPKPEIDYKLASNTFLIAEKDWVKEFQQM